MKVSSETAYDRLRALVSDDRRRTEIESREHLIQCLSQLCSRGDILCDGFVSSIICFRHEDPGRYGPCDLIIVAEVIESTEEVRRRAFIWEVKAPQSHLFEEDTRNRARPSPHLIQAENQLFHYHEDRAGSEAFRSEFSLLSSEDVLMGGVIIGRSDNILKSKASVPLEEKERIYGTALRLRRRYIYKKNNMQLMTWSNVLRRLQPATRGEKVLEEAGILDGEMVRMAEEEGLHYVGRNHEGKLSA